MLALKGPSRPLNNFRPFAQLERPRFDWSKPPTDEEVVRAIRSTPRHFGKGSSAFQDILFSNQSPTEYTAYAPGGASTAEGTLLTGGEQYCFPAFYFDQARRKQRIRISLGGVISTGGAYVIQLRGYLYTAAGSTSYGSMTKIFGNLSTVAVAGALTNAHWKAWVDILCQQPGGGTGAMTLACDGEFCVMPATTTAASYYPLGPDSMATPQTWTTTLDGGSPQYLYITGTFGTASASNSWRLMKQYIEGQN